VKPTTTTRSATLLLGATLALTAAPALADWASGGGELLKDAHNPWYLHNTKTVSTCLVIDDEHFHSVDNDEGKLERRIHDANAYWRREFKKAWVVGHMLEVATQAFVVDGVVRVTAKNRKTADRDCPAGTDLTVQFGWLSPEQVAFFESHMGGVQKFVSAIVRTHYEPTTMHGRGFLYLSADSGPLAPTDPAVVRNPWALGDGNLIDAALTHELGHLYGLPHKGLWSVMAVDYLERAFRPENAAAYAVGDYYGEFFAWNREDGSVVREYCNSSVQRAGWRRFLGTPADHTCIKMLFENKQVAFYTGTDADGDGPAEPELTRRGLLTLDAKETFNWEEAGRIYLPEGQTVITRIPDGAGEAPYLLGPMVRNAELSGTFTSEDGTLTRRVFLTLAPHGIGFASSRFAVEMDGQWLWNLDFEY
jgi:hypothetical protein